MSVSKPGTSMDMVALAHLMKRFEMSEAGRSLMPGLPVVARLDGRSFSQFTKGLDKPFDAAFVRVMDEVVKDLTREFAPDCAYTQSDEITLAWAGADPESSQMAFGGRVQKMVSLLAARASAKFALEMTRQLPKKFDAGAVPTLDCRVWQFPTLALAGACFVWREADAAKNSLSMLASSRFTHAQLQGMSGPDRKALLLSEGVDWSALDPRLKRGAFCARRKTMRELTPEELERVPQERRPTGPVERWSVELFTLPPLGRIANREAVLFEGAEPVELSADALAQGRSIEAEPVAERKKSAPRAAR